LTRCFSLPKKLNVQLWFLPLTFYGGAWYRSVKVLFNNFELMENDGFLWGIITFIWHKHSDQDQFTGMFYVYLIYIWGDSQFAQLNCSLKRQLKTLFNFLAPHFHMINKYWHNLSPSCSNELLLVLLRWRGYYTSGSFLLWQNCSS